MTADPEARPPLHNFIQILRAELAWYPGRPALAGRIVLACTGVMLVAMIFRLPGAVLGASFPILISRENLKATRVTAFQIGLACSIATAEVIAGGVLTAGSPFLHVIWVVASLFAAFFVMSSLNFAGPSLTFGAVLALDIRLWDYPISAEARVEHTLYTLLAILIGCAVTVLIEGVFSKKSPPEAVIKEISRRLNLVETLLSEASQAGRPSSTTTIQLARSAARGVDDLRQGLASSNYNAAFRDLLATVIALTGQLTDLASNLAESAPVLSLEDQGRCEAIAQDVALVGISLARRHCPEWIDLPPTKNSSNPILIEMERTANLIIQSLCSDTFRIHSPSPAVVATRSTAQFIADALRNAEHSEFAVRGMLSALVCYLFYMSTGWLGLVSSTLTCMLTARRLTGGGRQRQAIRFAGFLIGAGVIGLGTEVFILPQLNSIAEFTLLFASIVWIGAWVSTSGPRIAFAGLQIVLSYNLVTLNAFTINTTLVPARDAVLGIVLGIAAMWLVFDHLWASTSSGSARGLLLVTLQSVANFEVITAAASQEAYLRSVEESSRINSNFNKLRDLADMYAFESFPKNRQETLVNRSVRTLLPELRAFLLIKAALMQQRCLSTVKIEESLAREVENSASDAIRRIANAIERESAEGLMAGDALTQQLRERLSAEEDSPGNEKGEERHTEVRLCHSLLDLASGLERKEELNFRRESAVKEPLSANSIGAIAH